MGTLTKDVDGNDAANPQGAATQPVRAASGRELAKTPPTYPEVSRRPNETPAKPGGGGSSGQRPPVVASGSGEGFFNIYKKGQGYWTRMGTVGGAALIGALTVQFIYNERGTFRLSDTGGVAACAIFAVGYCLLAFFLMNRPTNADFLIATDSELKKVNWTSREELVGSTKVVILFMFVIAIFLFVVDLFFQYFFYAIGVLKERPW
jgi:preprotein translocase subunit SecE